MPNMEDNSMERHTFYSPDHPTSPNIPSQPEDGTPMPQNTTPEHSPDRKPEIDEIDFIVDGSTTDQKGTPAPQSYHSEPASNEVSVPKKPQEDVIKHKNAPEWFKHQAENTQSHQSREYWVGNGKDIPDKRQYLRDAGMSEAEITTFINNIEPEIPVASAARTEVPSPRTQERTREIPSVTVTYSDLRYEYSKVTAQLLTDKSLTPVARDVLKEAKRTLEGQMNELEEQAAAKGLFTEIEKKERELKTRLFEYQADLLPAEERDRLEKQITNWNVGKGGKSSPELDGIREDYLARRRSELMRQLKNEKSSDKALMKQVRKLDEPPPKRLAGIDAYKPEAQREAMRIVIEELEMVDVSPRESANNAMRGAIEGILPRLSPEVQSEVRARLHLHACAMSLRKVNTADAEKVGSEFAKAVVDIGDYALTGTDFETLLQTGLPGLKIGEAFNVLQNAAYDEMKFSGKKSETQLEQIRSELVQRIHAAYGNDPSFDLKAAQTSYDLAMKIADATFERSVWDTSAGDYMSQAIYFSKWRKEKNKGPQVTIDHIDSIGTSFFRSVQTAENKRSIRTADGNTEGQKVRLFHSDDWFKVRNTAEPLRIISKDVIRRRPDTQDALYSARFKALQLQRIQPKGSEDVAKLFFNGNERVATTFVAENRIQNDRLDFRGVDFRQMSGTAYKDFLSGTMKEILEAKDLLTKTSIGPQDLRNDNTLLSWAETLDKVDPYGVMSLRFYFIAGAIDAALNSGMEYTEADRVARNLHLDKRSGKGVYYYLGEYLATGEKTEDALRDMTQYRRRGMVNALVNSFENLVGRRR